MRNFLIGFSLCLVAVISGYVAAQPMSQNRMTPLPPTMAGQATRDCILPAGGWTVIDCSAGAAYSAQLGAWGRYLLQATADTVYFATDDAASGADADANDGYLNEGEIIPILTTDTVRYVTCLGTASAGKLKYIECQ